MFLPEYRIFWQKIFLKLRKTKIRHKTPTTEVQRWQRPKIPLSELRAPNRFTILVTSHKGKKNWRLSVNYPTAYFFMVLFVTIVILSMVGIFFYIYGSGERDEIIQKAKLWKDNQKLAFHYLDQIEETLVKMDEIGREMYEFVWKEKVQYLPLSDKDYLLSNFNNKTRILMKSLRFFYAREDAYQNMPRGMPLESAFVTSLYGHRISPFGFEVHFHSGIDFANSIGTPVMATADGEVIAAQSEGGGYGKHVRILHKYGLVTLYAHLSELKVEKGQRVQRGDVIGLLGQTGSATGPHLHYEVRLRNADLNNVVEITFNPWPFIKEL